MPTLPLFDPPDARAAAGASPDAWHRVTAPGGYEWWYFDAEDATGDVQLVAILFEGFVFHPGYLRAHARYTRRPTRVAPAVPSQYPCAYFAVYEKGRVAAQFMTQYPPGAFAASAARVDVRVGPNTLAADAGDGTLRLSLTGSPWRLTWQGPQRLPPPARLAADLAFRPLLPHPPQERRFLSREMTGADHFWVIANPLCEVTGTIRLPMGAGARAGGNGTGGAIAAAERVIEFRGRGYHDHNYGTAPIGPGLRRWMWGRVLGPGRVSTFHVAEPRDRALPGELHLVEADERGPREVARERPPAAAWDRRTATGLAYPSSVDLGGGLRLSDPRVVDAAPFYLRLTYRAGDAGDAGRAFCEVAYPHRLRWPVLGRMIEMSIHRDNG